MAPSKNTEREAREARNRLRRYNARQAVHTHQIRRRTRDNVISLAALIVVAALATATQVFYFTAGPGKPKPTASASATPTPKPAAGKNVGDIPSRSVAEDRSWTGSLTLNKVKLGITLDGAAAPQAVASFVTEQKDGYYIGKKCVRLVKSSQGGLIQCGSEHGDDGRDADYSFGPIENAPKNQIYTAGTIALARGSNNAYSQGHQFFIVYQTIELPSDSAGGYTVFGHVTSGLRALESQIVKAGVGAGGTSSQDGPPVTPTSITAFTIK